MTDKLSNSHSERWEMHVTEVATGKTIIHCDDVNEADGKAFKIHVMGVGFRTNGAFRASNLRVAKWEDAFMEDNGMVMQKGSDFIYRHHLWFYLGIADLILGVVTAWRCFKKPHSLRHNRKEV